jgi:hypothetical protein
VPDWSARVSISITDPTTPGDVGDADEEVIRNAPDH